jgi:hypothetical protein
MMANVGREREGAEALVFDRSTLRLIFIVPRLAA